MADLNNAAWNETDGNNTSAPPTGWPAGMLPNQVEPTAQAMMGAIKRFWNRINGVNVSNSGLMGPIPGLYLVNTTNTSYPIAYVDGERFTFKAHQASRGGVGGDTLNWNGLGDKQLYKPTTAGIAPIDINDIVNGQRVDVIYDVTLNSSAGGFLLQSAPTASIAAPTGTIVAFAGAAPPGGWLLCNGLPVPRSSYPALFAVIGTTYGSTGGTDFKVPDLRGRVAAGLDNMGTGAAGRLTAGSGIAGTTLGAFGGHELLQSHGHGVTDGQHSHGATDFGHQHHLWSYGQSATPGGGGISYYNSDRGDGELYTDYGAANIGISSSGSNISIQGAGGGGGQNVQPTLLLNYIIKT